MLINNIRSGIRNLWKTRTFSAINIVGLSLGIAVFLLILAYLRFEYSYEGFADRAERSGIFLVPFVLILAIAAITISFQSIKAALTNPVKNLRTE